MPVRIVPKFTQADIKRVIAEHMQRLEDAVISRFQRIGEQFVTNARNKTKEQGGFGDISGNLRSSIGYLIIRNGKQLTGSGFESIAGGSVGSETGKKVIEEIAAKYPTGICLLVVAGMDYAAAVEAKSKDLLSGSSLIAITALKEAMQQISKKIA